MRFLKILFCIMFAFSLSACGNDSKVINTKKMPGDRVEKMLEKNNKSMHKTRSGVYVIKDNSTYNNTGRDFKTKPDVSVGPGDVRFESEHFKTRY